MSDLPFTEGPWCVADDGDALRVFFSAEPPAEGGQDGIFIRDSEDATDQDRADALLMAAAPEMFDLIQTIRFLGVNMSRMRDDPLWRSVFESAYNDAQEIAKRVLG